ncbi:MAG: hypothetical protein PUJ70_00140 [Treponema sp.]|nr:hypothetical protein [Treponema sp.]MDY5837260.1 hypothetical protein [Treponema sp.]
MKKIFSFFAVFLLVFFSAFEFSSCVVEGDSSGSVRVALPGNSRGAFVFNEEAASYFELNLKGVGIDRSEIGYAGTIVSFNNIPVGDYDLDVTVFADNHIAFASGSRKVTVQANSSELVEITAHMLYGMKLGSSILDSNYYLFGRSESGLEYVIPEVEDFAASISPSSILKGTDTADSLIFTVAKDSFYYSTYAAPCSRSDGKVVSISDCPETFDVYYEDVNDRVWCFGKTNTNIKYFALTSKEFNVAATTECTGSGDFPDSLLNLYCIAAKDDRVYVAYNNTNHELMIQTYIAEESGNLIKAGNAVHVSVPGISNKYSIEITDMQVMYDGNLYVLVRDYCQDNNHYCSFETENYDTGEYCAYSRGAIIKYSTVGNVLNMEKILGWTKNPKVMAPPSELIPVNPNILICKKLNAYIPEVGDFSNSFLGPMRFIAVKPKELVVADFGVNVWLADDKKKINGGMKFHSRAVSVDLASFAIRDICEFTNFDFDNANANSSLPVVTYSELSYEYSRDGEY